MNFSVFNKNNMIDTKSMLFYCREGYEADLAAELEIVSADQKLYGYSQFLRNSAMVQFHFYQALSAHEQFTSFALNECIFARQRLCVIGRVELADANDRITTILDYLKDNTKLSQ